MGTIRMKNGRNTLFQQGRRLVGIMVGIALFLSCSKNDDAAYVELEQAVLLTPADQLMEVDFEGLTFEWQAIRLSDGREIYYTLYLDTIDLPQSRPVENLRTTTYRLQNILSPDTTYYWYVVAKDAKGNTSNSKIGVFKTRKLTTEEFIRGKWMRDKEFRGEVEVSLTACERESFYHFFADYTFLGQSYEEEEEGCVDSEILASTYRLVGKDTLFITTKAGEVPMRITQLTSTTLQLSIGNLRNVFKRTEEGSHLNTLKEEYK